MLRLLVDTDVWLQIVQDYRNATLIEALERMIAADEVQLVVPEQAAAEFARNKERIVRESSKSLSGIFKRVRAAVEQFADGDERDAVLKGLHDVGHRITVLGEAVNGLIERVEALFAAAVAVPTTDGVRLRAAQRAIDKRAPFHLNKNSMGDAILIEAYADLIEETGDALNFAFVTHNKRDFSDMAANERKPHPDIAMLFDAERSIYALSLGEVLNAFAPEWMEEIKWEFDYEEQPRRLSEILAAEHLMFRQVWYNRHWNLRDGIETGKVRVVPDDKLSRTPYRQDEISESTWAGALAAAKRTEEEIGLDNLGPWTDFEWGMLSGKLSALRWVTGSEWDFLDT
jgi:hypothetical protein